MTDKYTNRGIQIAQRRDKPSRMPGITDLPLSNVPLGNQGRVYDEPFAPIIGLSSYVLVVAAVTGVSQ